MATPYLSVFTSCLLFAHFSLLGCLSRLVESFAFHYLLAELIFLLSAFPLYISPFSSLFCSSLFCSPISLPPALSLWQLHILYQFLVLSFGSLLFFFSTLTHDFSQETLLLFKGEKEVKFLNRSGMKPVSLIQSGEDAHWMNQRAPAFGKQKHAM